VVSRKGNRTGKRALHRPPIFPTVFLTTPRPQKARFEKHLEKKMTQETKTTEKTFSAAYIAPGHGRSNTTLVLATLFGASVGAYDHALPLPQSTGDKVRDSQIIAAFDQTAEAWSKRGVFVDPLQVLQVA
jgi:hypothetical protein